MLLQTTTELPPAEQIGRLTVDQYFRMIAQGILREGAPYELLDGLLVLKDRSTKGEGIMTIGAPHTISVGLLSELTPLMRPHGCYMQIQGPVCIPPLHAPEPDGAIVKGDRRDYPELPPHAANVSCVIEVADSSLERDRTDKGAKYAEAMIPQYVIVNLINRVVEVYENPDARKRRYLKSQTIKSGKTVPFLMADGTRLDVPVTDLLP